MVVHLPIVLFLKPQDSQVNSEHQAPVFNVTVTVNPKVVTTGGDGTLSEGTKVEDGIQVEDTTAVEATPLELRVDEPIPVIDEPVENYAPVNKADEPTLVHPIWGGMTVEEFNRVYCSDVAEARRAEPVDPVYEGCRDYWDEP